MRISDWSSDVCSSDLVQATQRNLINPLGMPLIAARFFAEHSISRMQIHRPSAISDRVSMFTLFYHIPLGKHVIAFKTTAFPLSRNGTHPFQGQVGRFRIFSRLFNIIPEERKRVV